MGVAAKRGGGSYSSSIASIFSTFGVEISAPSAFSFLTAGRESFVASSSCKSFAGLFDETAGSALFFLPAGSPSNAPSSLSQTRLTGNSTSSAMNFLRADQVVGEKQPAPLVLPLPIFRGVPSLFKVFDICFQLIPKPHSDQLKNPRGKWIAQKT